MKTRTTLLVVAVTVINPSAPAQLLLGAGEAYEHEFQDLPFQRYQTNFFPPYSEFGFSVIPGSFEPGTQLKYEMFANALSEPPARSGVLEEMPGDTYTLVPLGVWDDRQGAVRLTVLTGSVILSEIRTGVWTPRDNRTHSYYGTTVVPAPRLLHRSLDGGHWQFSWTTNAVDYQLESSPDLLMPAWSFLTNNVQVIGRDYAIQVDLSAVQQQFFRLHKP